MSIVNIVCDFRERTSDIPKLLSDKNANISFSSLATGDYIINDQIIVERKTGVDFIQSISDNRIFEQCSKLKKDPRRNLILIEGNPYETSHKINANAIRGSILSILTGWQIPVIYSANAQSTVDMLMTLGTQSLKNTDCIRLYKGIKKKKRKNQRLRFLQGIPSIGPVNAARLIDYFGNIKSLVNASNDDLNKIKGFGKTTAKKIVEFFEY